MSVGEEAELVVHSRFAYGSIGRSALSGKKELPAIPPDAVITYNITLLSVDIEPDLESMSYEQIRKIGYDNII